jgi:hypothetical protein
LGKSVSELRKGVLELLPNLLLAALAVFGSGRVFKWWRGAMGAEPLLWEGFSGLAGMVLLATLAGLINVFAPLSVFAAWIVIPFAVMGAWMLVRQTSLDFCLIFFGLLFLAAVLGSRWPLHGDTGLYHQQAVIWMSETALPYGLANLHGRFGFNSAWWSLMALFQMPWMERGASMNVATPLLCVFSGLLFVGAVRSAWNTGLNVAVVLLMAGGYLWFRQMSGANNPSLSTDAPANLFILASAAALLLWRQEKLPQLLLMWAILAAGAAAWKLTGLPWLAASALAVGWYTIVGMRERDAACSWYQVWPGVLAAFAILGVNALRGVIVSGYPFYPLKLAGFATLPWVVRPETIGGDTEGIRNWPTRGEASGWFEFLGNWIENQYGLTNVITATLLSMAAATLLVFAGRRGRSEVRWALADTAPVALAAGIGLAVCFAFAPALRFVSGYFFVLVGCLLGLGLGASLRPTCSLWRGRVAAVVAVLFAVLPNFRGLSARSIEWRTIPSAPETAVGLSIRTTAQGEPIKIGFAWNAEPPATPNFNPRLVTVRDENGAIYGFRAGPEQTGP